MVIFAQACKGRSTALRITSPTRGLWFLQSKQKTMRVGFDQQVWAVSQIPLLREVLSHIPFITQTTQQVLSNKILQDHLFSSNLNSDKEKQTDAGYRLPSGVQKDFLGISSLRYHSHNANVTRITSPGLSLIYLLPSADGNFHRNESKQLRDRGKAIRCLF